MKPRRRRRISRAPGMTRTCISSTSAATRLSADSLAEKDPSTTSRHHRCGNLFQPRSEEHTSELQSLMRISYAVFCLKKKKKLLRPRTQTSVSALRRHDHSQLHYTRTLDGYNISLPQN